TAAGFGYGWARRMVGHNRAASRAKQVASSQPRRTDLAKHPQIPPSTLLRLAKDHDPTSLYVVCRSKWVRCKLAMRRGFGLGNRKAPDLSTIRFHVANSMPCN